MAATDMAHVTYLLVLTGIGFVLAAAGASDAGSSRETRPVSGSTAAALRITPAPFLSGRRARRTRGAQHPRLPAGWIFFVSGFFEPFFYLLSIGVGLNHLVGPLVLGGHSVPYTAFVAPGLLASSAMNGAVFDSTFNIFFKLKIAKTYDAMLSTPLAPTDIALGELTWALMRGSIYSAAFLAAMTGFGYMLTPWAILCFPAPCSRPSPSPVWEWRPRPTCGAGRTSTRSPWPSSRSFCSRPPSIRCRCTRRGCSRSSGVLRCTRGWP